MGDAFYYVVFAFMVEKVTGSIAMVGYVGATETLPFLLFSPYSGVLADRMDRKKIMLVSDLLSGSLLVAFSLMILVLGQPPVWAIFVVAGLLSTVRAFFMPAKNAAIPALVPADDLMRANSLSMTTQQTMPVIALSLSAGVLAALYQLSPTWFFASSIGINSLSFFGSAFFVAKLPKILPDRKADMEHAFQDLKHGIGYIKRRHELKILLLLQGLVNMMIAPFFVVYVAANKQWFDGKPQTLTFFELSFFVGMVFGSIAVGRMKVTRVGASYIAAIGLCGLTIALMAVSRTYVGFTAWNFAAGLAIPFAWLPVNTWLQSSVEDAFRGRVNSVYSMVTMGVMPLGQSLAGVLVKQAGLANAFLIMGVGMVGAAVVGLADRRFRVVRMTGTEATLDPGAPSDINIAIPNAVCKDELVDTETAATHRAP